MYSNWNSENGHEYLHRSCFWETSKECTSHGFSAKNMLAPPSCPCGTSMCWTQRYMVWPKDGISTHMILLEKNGKSAQDVPFLQRKYLPSGYLTGKQWPIYMIVIIYLWKFLLFHSKMLTYRMVFGKAFPIWHAYLAYLISHVAGCTYCE